MTTTKVKRSQVATFLNTSSTSGATYKLVGVGVTTGKINYNPKMHHKVMCHLTMNLKFDQAWSRWRPKS